jgi:hypothetical protein
MIHASGMRMCLAPCKHLLIYSRTALQRLVRPQCCQRINSRRAMRRGHARSQSHEHNACHGRCQAGEITRLQSIQHRCQRLPGDQGEGDSDCRAHSSQHETISKHHPNHMRALCAHGHTQADFDLTIVHVIEQSPGQARCHQHDRKNREEPSKAGE